MKNLKTQLLKNFLNSFMLFLPKESNHLKEYIIGEHNNWSILNPYFLRSSLKQIIFFLKRLTKKKKKKILFLIESQYLSTLEPVLRNSKQIYTTNYQKAFYFFYHSIYSKRISAIILIGDFASYPIESFKKLNIPVFFVCTSRKKDFEYVYYQSLENYSSLLILRHLLKKAIK
jgi:hypothetical protein